MIHYSLQYEKIIESLIIKTVSLKLALETIGDKRTKAHKELQLILDEERKAADKYYESREKLTLALDSKPFDVVEQYKKENGDYPI